MGNVLTVFGFFTLTGLVNGTNFIIIFISLVIVFFLLGMVIGFHINSNKHVTKDDITTEKTNTSGKSRAISTLEQDITKDNTTHQINNSYHSPSHHKHHKHSKKYTITSIK
jgi:hypothetical protein